MIRREHGFNELKFVNREIKYNQYKNIKWQQCGLLLNNVGCGQLLKHEPVVLDSE